MYLKTSVIILLLILISCYPDNERVSERSKTSECKQNIISALTALSPELGLPIQIGLNDANEMFKNDVLMKSYGRDGIMNNVFFGFETKENGCNLVFYRQDKKGPGIESLSYSDYGHTLLEDCLCEKT